MKNKLEFTGAMTPREYILAVMYLPVHVFGLPSLARLLYARGFFTAVQVNTFVYAVGAVFMLSVLWDYYRRQFFNLCDRPFYCLVIVGVSYLIMLGFNLLISSLLLAAAGDMNPNTEAIAGLSQVDMGSTAAIAVFMAPILEEPIFRGAIFGSLRKKSRFAAYAVSMLLFGIYHVWGYAISDPIMWLYIIQYLPVSFLLAQCYERTDSIWTSIFFHMLVNGVSLAAVGYLGELL